MTAADIRLFVDAMYLANYRLLDHASRLPPELFTASAQTERDLRATLVHELDVEWSWRLNLQGLLDTSTEELKPIDYPDVETLRRHWEQDEAELRAWLDPMTDEDLAAEIDSKLSNDRRPLWQYVMHIVMHATQQQADAATILSTLGESPGEISWFEFVRQLDPQEAMRGFSEPATTTRQVWRL